MRIYLLRHGRAEDGFGKPDGERALTLDGREKLQAAAAAWRRLIDGLDLVVASPLRRAQETAVVLTGAVLGEPRQRTEALLTPGADPQLALEMLVAEQQQGTNNVALVGHEPHLGGLLGLLLTGEQQRSIALKKGMLVAVDLDSPTSLIGTLVFALGQKAAAALG
jgi:phosphohistidine phosphatase